MIDSRSLRHQLFLLGLVSALLPLALLVGVVFATSSEEVGSPAPFDPADEPFEDSSSGVPPEVPIAAVALGLGILAAVWWWSGRAVRPLEIITHTTAQIQEGSLDRRVGLEGAATEIQALGDSFDHMLDRLQRSSSTQRQMIEDASHELRTPLAALAVNAEVILNNPAPTLAQYRESAERSDALIHRLQTTIDDLLSSARDRTEQTGQVDNDLAAIAGRVIDRQLALHPTAVINYSGPDELFLGIHGPSIERALANLIENAQRFSPADQAVTVEIHTGPPVTLSVTDQGPGIEAADLTRVFDRYYTTGDGSEGGLGIGLALVKQVAEAHGEIEVQSPPPGIETGTQFRLTFR